MDVKKSLFVLFFSFSFFFGCQSKKKSSQADVATEKAQKSEFSDNIKLSLAEWSYHRAMYDGEFKHIDFPAKARELGFEGVEYVSSFFEKKENNMEYLQKLNKAAKDANVEQLLIMVDGEGDLGDQLEANRKQAVLNHYKWIDAAKTLGCHSIRVNAMGSSNGEHLKTSMIKSMQELATYGATQGINIIIENHGGLSSDAEWLSGLIRTVNKNNCGSLPDFGNFCIAREGGDMYQGKCIKSYDRYDGLNKLMPFAKAVSAKSYDFDSSGQESTMDYNRLLSIIKKHNYKGYIGVEYEGKNLSEKDGIIATRKLIEQEILSLSQ